MYSADTQPQDRLPLGRLGDPFRAESGLGQPDCALPKVFPLLHRRHSALQHVLWARDSAQPGAHPPDDNVAQLDEQPQHVRGSKVTRLGFRNFLRQAATVSARAGS